MRLAGIQENILILGYTPKEHFHYLHEENIVQSLISIEYARELSEYAKKQNVCIRTHCKVDTGMCRTGIIYQENDKHMDDIVEEYHLQYLKVEGIFLTSLLVIVLMKSVSLLPLNKLNCSMK